MRDSFLEKLGLETMLKLPICVETPILPVGRPRGDVGGECFAPLVLEPKNDTSVERSAPVPGLRDHV